MKDAIFYSNYCSYCKQLLELLEKKSIKNKFVPICIDSPNIRLPKMIQQVPTLIIDNKLLVGQNAFEFIMKNFKDEIVETWDGGEMGNFSTAYSYIEEDKTTPMSVYGKSKLQGESAIIDSKCKYLIFRTSWLYSTYGNNFVKTVLRVAKEKSELRVVCDQIGTPTSAELVADVTSLCLYRIIQENYLSKDIPGVYHLTPTGKTSWYNFAKYVIIETKKLGGIFLTDPENIIAINTSEYPLPAERPANSLLNSQKLCKTFNLYLPSWKIHADRTIKELYLREI